MTGKPDFAKVEDLIPDDKNPIRHDEKNIKEIMRSLEEFGQHAPLVVQQSSNRVIVGNARLEAAKRLGWEKVWVMYVDDDDTKAIRRGIADNKTGELSTWNDAALKLLLEDLSMDDAADIPGFDPEEIEKILSSMSGDGLDIDFSSYEDEEGGKKDNKVQEWQCPKCGFKFTA